MKIDTTKVLKNLEGNEMKSVEENIGEDGQTKIIQKPLILRNAISSVLNMENQEHRLTAEKKNQAFQIMQKLWSGNGKEIDLTIPQKAFIIERSLIFYPPMTAGVIGLEPTTVECTVGRDATSRNLDERVGGRTDRSNVAHVGAALWQTTAGWLNTDRFKIVASGHCPAGGGESRDGDQRAKKIDSSRQTEKK